MNAVVERTAVVLDRHPLWLDALEHVLVRLAIVPIGMTTRTAHALELVAEQQPSLLILDPQLGEEPDEGVACIREARARAPQLRVVAISSSSEQHDIHAAFEAGVAAYVVKTAHADDMAAAIRQTFDHSIFFPNRLSAVPRVEASAGDGGELTPREREILVLAAEGFSNAQLARSLWVTEQTVKFHLSNIYRKLGVANRTEAGRWAERQGLLAAEAASA